MSYSTVGKLQMHEEIMVIENLQDTDTDQYNTTNIQSVLTTDVCCSTPVVQPTPCPMAPLKQKRVNLKATTIQQKIHVSHTCIAGFFLINTE